MNKKTPGNEKIEKESGPSLSLGLGDKDGRRNERVWPHGFECDKTEVAITIANSSSSSGPSGMQYGANESESESESERKVRGSRACLKTKSSDTRDNSCLRGLSLFLAYNVYHRI